METIRLNTGFEMPKIGFGTWQIAPEDATRSVQHAIRTGFRHIDGAALYANEPQVGEGIRRSIADGVVTRSELFVTSKVWNTERGYEKTLRSFEKSLKDFGLEYFDLFLIHWPANPFQFDSWKQLNTDTWRAMEKMVREGKVRSIGVSNFMPRHLKPLLDTVEIQPSVNQIEYHPGWVQKDCVDFCNSLGIAVQAWSPLGQGSAIVQKDIVELAAKYGRTPGQIVLRWVMQTGVVPLTRSVKEARIEENFACQDFDLSDADLQRISALGYCGGKCRNPDLVPY